jgi:hypothetical protein
MENNTNKRTIVPRNIRMPRRESVILPREIKARSRSAMIVSSRTVWDLSLMRIPKSSSIPITKSTSRSSMLLIKPMMSEDAILR